jgi:uncharacterized membrane protein
MFHKSCFLAGLAAALMLASGLQAFGGKPTKPPTISYQIVQLDLADSAGATYTGSVANGINRQGHVVGLVEEPSAGCLPACWTISKIDGLQSELNLLEPPFLPDEPTVYAAACGINESGLIVGGWDNGGGNVPLAGDALYWATCQSSPELLPPLDVLGRRTAAFAVNNSGVACGLSERAVIIDGVVDHYETRAAVWRIRQNMEGEFVVDGPVELPPLAGQPCAVAVAINDKGDGWADVVGNSFQDLDITGPHGVVWSVKWNDQGTLVVDGPAEVLSVAEYSKANGVNDAGAVCGALSPPGGAQQAVVWSGGPPLTLNLARYFFFADAYDVNNNGMIVGYAYYHKMYASGERAVMWPSATGAMVDLNQFLDDDSPFGILCVANAVNDAGEIVGYGWDGSNYTGFLAVPR